MQSFHGSNYRLIQVWPPLKTRKHWTAVLSWYRIPQENISTSISSNCMRKYYVPSYNLQTEVFFRRVVTKLVTELYKLSKDKQLKSLNIFRLSCGRAPLDLILALCILHSDFSINIYCFLLPLKLTISGAIANRFENKNLQNLR